MSKVLIENSTLANIAEAIRNKSENNSQMLPSEMPEHILNIDTGKVTIDGEKVKSNLELYSFNCDLMFSEEEFKSSSLYSYNGNMLNRTFLSSENGYSVIFSNNIFIIYNGDNEIVHSINSPKENNENFFKYEYDIKNSYLYVLYKIDKNLEIWKANLTENNPNLELICNKTITLYNDIDFQTSGCVINFDNNTMLIIGVYKWTTSTTYKFRLYFYTLDLASGNLVLTYTDSDLTDYSRGQMRIVHSFYSSDGYFYFQMNNESSSAYQRLYRFKEIKESYCNITDFKRSYYFYHNEKIYAYATTGSLSAGPAYYIFSIDNTTNTATKLEGFKQQGYDLYYEPKLIQDIYKKPYITINTKGYATMVNYNTYTNIEFIDMPYNFKSQIWQIAGEWVEGSIEFYNKKYVCMTTSFPEIENSPSTNETPTFFIIKVLNNNINTLYNIT